MKRYNMKPKYTHLSPMSDTIRCGAILADPIEDPNGAWVKWEDHKEEFFRFTEIYEKRIRELKAQIGQECNCEEKSKTIIKQWPSTLIESWVCPAHGYKRR